MAETKSIVTKPCAASRRADQAGCVSGQYLPVSLLSGVTHILPPEATYTSVPPVLASGLVQLVVALYEEALAYLVSCSLSARSVLRPTPALPAQAGRVQYTQSWAQVLPS